MTAGVQTGKLGGNDAFLDSNHCAKSVDNRYRTLWSQFEDAVDVHKKHMNHPGLLNNQRGRGVNTACIQVHSKIHTVKPGRQGEPRVFATRPTHQLKQWLIQWRRLVNLKRLCQPTASPGSFSHKCALWTAIRRAKGFPQGFIQWWSVRPVQDPSHPSAIGYHCPDYDTCSCLCDAVEACVRHVEKQLHEERSAAIKARYQRNANHVFKDVKLTGPQSVETLLDIEEAEVAEVDEEDSVILTHHCSFNPDLPVYGGMSPLRITMVDTDQVWFTTPHGLLPGMKISQRTPVGSEQEVFQRFAAEWTQRWNKHQHMPAERWQQINRFIAAAFPTRAFQLPDIDVEMWDDAVQSKPKRSAAGLDGVQRDDLRLLSPQGKTDMLEFITQCERVGEWPQAMCHGAVHSLQKVADATHASQYRPITILSLCYRVWSSIRGRSWSS